MNEILEQSILDDLNLRQLATGEKLGPLTGYPSIDKPWLKYYNEDQIKTTMPQMTCYDYLFECNKKHLSNTALSYFGRKITFEELFLNIDSVAQALKAAGVKENDIITISLPNIPEAAYLFYACSKIGAIANMVDPRTSDKGIESYIEEVNSKLVIIVDAYYYKIKNLAREGKVEQIIPVSPAESLPLGLNLGYRAKNFLDTIKDSSKKIEFDEKTIKWTDFMRNRYNYSSPIEADYIQNRPLVIEHTGGTTGKPKGVVLSNENINSVVLQSVLTGIDMQRHHNWLDIMPTFIAYGVGMGLHLPLTIGMETILIPQFDAKKFDELLVKHQPIHMVGVPSYWQTIIDSKKLANADLSYIIAPTVGGDAMKISLEKAANEFLENHNCTSKITKGYGMTEVCGGVAGTIDENNEIGSVGIPFVKTIISVFNPETGEECHYNEPGEICMTGPNTMLGYYDNETATNDILRQHEDGRVWVHSGDIGYMTENGNIFIIDRLKRMIIRYDGFKVFPSMIENVICSHEAVETCSVVGIDDLNHGQGRLPKAHIVLKPEYENDYKVILEEIEALCVSNIQEYALPYDYVIKTELPLTSVGKVDYLALEAEDKVQIDTHQKTLSKRKNNYK
ncbi:MAG: acyl--CoA ligase [Clostridia bacterium]|nr:acyl--CoA ligase [Clostridia bacterium]